MKRAKVWHNGQCEVKHLHCCTYLQNAIANVLCHLKQAVSEQLVAPSDKEATRLLKQSEVDLSNEPFAVLSSSAVMDSAFGFATRTCFCAFSKCVRCGPNSTTAVPITPLMMVDSANAPPPCSVCKPLETSSSPSIFGLHK